ncbi:ribonuclease H-like domain-containing protein [Rhizophagus clarus]|uniref:Ribonuclease H-like domain-containing protein n=1 Tax=Rhizophagus clarus TaxID=94130 RepID=A0A8H3KMZ3_9GLOM|nr:ribonuclease H-like domain-containing protein [Rhizophagus clarus]
MEKVDPKRQKVNKDYGKNNEKVLNYLKSLQYDFKILKFKSTEEEVTSIDHPATLELFHFLNPHLILPNKKALSDRILKKEIKSLNTLRDKKLISDKIGVDALDISSERKPIIEVVPKITSLIQDIKSLNIKLNAIVSDSAPAYTAARKAITVIAYFKNANNSYFIGKLRDIQSELYNKYYSINLAIHHERLQTGLENTEELYLNSGLCQILLDNDWWEKIELLQDILLPYCGVLNKLQCDKTRLFEVLHAIGYFMQFWKHFPDSNLTWFKKCTLRLLLDFEDYRQKIKPFNSETLEQFKDDTFKFWGYVQGNYKELVAVALKLFSMCNEKVLAMSQLWAAINFSLREKELQQNQIQFSDSNTFSIDTSSEDATLNLNVEEIKNDIEDNTIFTSEHWEQELEKWEEMLIEEELVQLEGEEKLRNNSDSLKKDLLNKYTHPAVDKKAKCELKNLFNSSLSISNYLDVKSN